MRIARKLALLASLALAAMAMTAGSASATGALEVYENDGGGSQHCGTVSVVDHEVTGGCEAIATSSGTVELEGEVFGFHIHESDCDNVFTVNFNEDGTGFVSGFQITNCSSNVTACNEGGSESNPEIPWAFAGEEDAANTVGGEIAVCINTALLGTCSGIFNVAIDTSSEDYVVSADGEGIGSSACEIDGTWILNEEHAGEIHVNHL